jgi:peptidoglycan/LPS O-acetylase OafA/YrhL
MSALSSAQFPFIPGLDLFMHSGSTGVSLFLVLSGFCLFLPFAGGRTDRFKAATFFRRRFRRLAPAYYVSLVLSLALALLTAAPLSQPPLTFDAGLWELGTHLTLTHSLFPDTFYALNGAYWSLGLEWQLYLGLPLLVFGIRRFGLTPTLIFAIACNVVYRLGLGLAIDLGAVAAGSSMADVVLPNQLFGRWAEFALGMLAAELYASGRLQRLGRRVPLLLLLGIVALLPIAFAVTKLQLSHLVYGAVFFLLLCVVLLSNNFVSRALAWRPLVLIGTLSYSLYLVHQPVIQAVTAWFAVYEPAASPHVVFVWLVVLFPAILFLAWLLFVLVERRTLGPSAENTLVPSFNVRLPALSIFTREVRPPSVEAASTD